MILKIGHSMHLGHSVYHAHMSYDREWRCSVLRCVAACGGVLQCSAVCCIVLSHDRWCRCSVLQCVAVCGSVLQCGAVRCIVLSHDRECTSMHVTWSTHATLYYENESIRTRHPMHLRHSVSFDICAWYWVATISRFLQIIGLFCKRAK